eukprot:TRINITY_DN1199_c0_g2_i2.p1 TRINITY_DN1199_c0_g2~~TRINITY_DN1199_c0_g2_i2.p1  ORF type:complete len:385 (-),score=56.77 TRINITY_DN1199_c0_g2_i2:616-1770(-)
MGLNDAMGISFDQISRTDKGVNIKDPRATNMAIAIASLGKLMEDRDHQVTQATQIMLWNMKHTLNGGISVLQATAQSSSSTTKNWKEFPRLLAIIKSDAARYRIKLHSFHLDAPLERMTLKQFIAEVALIPGRDMKRNVLKKKDPIFNWPISFLDPRFSTENMRRMLTKRTTHTDTEKMENDIFPDKTLPATWMKAILADPTAIKYGAFANPKAYYRYLTMGVHKVKDTIAATDGSYGKSKSKYNASGAIVTVDYKKVTFTLMNTESVWQAEVMALLLASHFLENSIIYSDSLAAVKMIKEAQRCKWWQKGKRKIAEQGEILTIAENCKKSQNKVKHVKAHTSRRDTQSTLNNMADQEAKEDSIRNRNTNQVNGHKNKLDDWRE